MINYGQQQKCPARLEPSGLGTKEVPNVRHQFTDTPSPQTTERPTRDDPCPHCGGSGQVFIDRLEAAGCPVDLTHACAYCEGRGCFTRPVLPRGAVRAFAVIDTSREWWADPEQLYWIVYATSASQAKMIQARNLASDLIPGRSMREVLPSLRVRRAPEHDGEAGR